VQSLLTLFADSLADLEACEHDAEESHFKIEELVRIGEDSKQQIYAMRCSSANCFYQQLKMNN
jgi:hypothetical protein